MALTKWCVGLHATLFRTRIVILTWSRVTVYVLSRMIVTIRGTVYMEIVASVGPHLRLRVLQKMKLRNITILVEVQLENMCEVVER